MRKSDKLGCVVVAICALLISGCNGSRHKSLLFVQSDTLGAAAGVGQSGQPVDVTVAYKGFNYARVPVARKDDSKNVTKIKGKFTESGKEFGDALSVFGRFKGNAGVQAGVPGIGLQKFFATGFSARKLAEGYQFAIPHAAKKNLPVQF